MKNEDVVRIEVSQEHDTILDKKFKIESFIGIFDGHGGDASANYAGEHLLPYLETVGRNNPGLSLTEIIKKAVKGFDGELIKHLMSPALNDKSGSCALFLAQTADKVCVASIGDSKAVIARQLLSEVENLTTPHKPEDTNERDRVSTAGGYIYRNQATNSVVKSALAQLISCPKKQPLRVFPSHLSITRAFGNGPVKASYPSVIISDPEVVEIEEDFLYMILASDGVFDTLSNTELAAIVAEVFTDGVFANIQQASEMVVSVIFQNLIDKYCYDNISLVFIAGSLLESLFQE